MIIRSFKFNRKLFIGVIFFILLVVSFISIMCFTSLAKNDENTKDDLIKWVDFNVPSEALEMTSKLDISSHINNEEIQYNWIELLAYLACKNGNNFENFKASDLDPLIENLKNRKTMAELTENMQYYDYYYKSFSAVLRGFIGNYRIETPSNDGSTKFETNYGIKAFLPIAKNYHFDHYDDFGKSRSYGFQRTHLGNDLMGNIGTPIIAVESGIIENIGWNQYGGWRIGIRSFDTQRYYYYAHLRKDHPYALGIVEGATVKAGDVIGYLGMTGYSKEENVNNVNIPHLHFGMQLIFDESQVDSPNEIWINVYEIIEFLKQNRSEITKVDSDTIDYVRKYDFSENSIAE